MFKGFLRWNMLIRKLSHIHDNLSNTAGLNGIASCLRKCLWGESDFMILYTGLNLFYHRAWYRLIKGCHKSSWPLEPLFLCWSSWYQEDNVFKNIFLKTSSSWYQEDQKKNTTIFQSTPPQKNVLLAAGRQPEQGPGTGGSPCAPPFKIQILYRLSIWATDNIL